MKVSALKAATIHFPVEITTYEDGAPKKVTVNAERRPVNLGDMNKFVGSDKIDQIVGVLTKTGFEDDNENPIPPSRELFEGLGWQEVVDPFYDAIFAGFMPEKKDDGNG